ncbi:MAG: vWA domain-containing protein [Deltaproteobacteria bacterium]
MRVSGYLCWVLLGSLVISCSSSTGLTGGGSVSENPSPAGDAPSNPPLSSLKSKKISLFWDGNDLSNSDLKLQGNQSHLLDSTLFQETQLSMGGIIKSTPQKRNIVLVIDVSGSTGNNRMGMGSDPLTSSGSCARLEAVKAVMNSAKAQGPSQFSVITFNHDVVRRTANFTSNLNEMFPGENLSSILCFSSGGTNYSEALAAAENVLQRIPSDQAKEVYFVTDGEPRYWNGISTFDQECNFLSVCSGINEANRLKASGVLLGTVMLGQNTQGSFYLQSNISGRDPNQQLLHVQANHASDLVASLSALSVDGMVAGTFQYRDPRSEFWNSVNMLSVASQSEFKIPTISFNPSLYPQGLEVQFVYATARGYRHSGFANVGWR